MDADIDRFESRRSVVYAPTGIVATSQPLAAEAGLDVLKSGGNAFDAAVATAAVLNVVEPTSTGLGGDVFSLYRTADGEVGGMQSCGGAPAEATIENVRASVREHDTPSAWYPENRGSAVDGGDDGAALEMPFRGPHAVTVPGTARGWEATVERFGNLGLGEALEPAIEYAIEGYPVSPVIAHHWQFAEKLFTDEHACNAYLPGGRAPRAGERVELPNLGESLRRIAEEGADVLYEGAIGEQIVDEIQGKGGLLSADDLAGFEPTFVDPVSTTYRGAEIFELPPNNQGLIALEALNIANELDAGDHPVDSPERIHYFTEAMKRAFHDGHRHITDPAFEETPALNTWAYAEQRASDIGETASDVSFGVPGAGAEDADTVLLCVADVAGNVVSYINSRFAGFGSGLVAGDTGIALQNRGASFSLDPDHPNCIEPGKRPFHTLIPALAHFDEDDWAAFGVMGGYMQPQGHVQVISNLLDYGMSIQEALDVPRWRYRESGQLAVEARMDSTIQTKLARIGHEMSTLPPLMFGGAQLVRAEGTGEERVLSGATEPRKDGSVVGY